MSPMWTAVFVLLVASAVVAALLAGKSKPPPRSRSRSRSSRREPPADESRAPARAASSERKIPAAPSVPKVSVASPVPALAGPPPPRPKLPSLASFDEVEDDESDLTRMGNVEPDFPVEAKYVDEGAKQDDPTSPQTLFLTIASAQTDKGLRRQRNEDSLLVLEDLDVYAVCDGMGGHRGGETASQTASQAIEQIYRTGAFPSRDQQDLPPRAWELARAVMAANDAVRAEAAKSPELKGMGTTVCAARFARNKGRFYAAHVGDSRLYRFRNGRLQQLTADHTMTEHGIESGPQAGYLSRAVGIWPVVKIDVIVGEPLPEDVFLLCSDGLTKMLSDSELTEALAQGANPRLLVQDLVLRANAKGGRDNITVIVIRVSSRVNDDDDAKET